MTAPVIRQATVEDIDELLRLRQVMFDALGWGRGDDSWRTPCADFLRSGFGSGDVAGFVGEIEGAVVGGGVGLVHRRLPAPGNPAGLYGYLQSMATDPAWRGRGIGGGIVDALLAWFGAQGVVTVDLHASPEGDPVYRARGFTPGDYPGLRLRI